MARQRDASREAFWRRMLQRRAKSGLPIAEFCENEGLATTTYHYWQRQIKVRDAESVSPDMAPGGGLAFTPVQLIDDRSLMAPVEVVAENGYVIRISEQATSEHMRRVLKAVDELR